MLKTWNKYCDNNKICQFFDSILCGYAQIAFSDNVLSALVMLIATWIGSPIQCICALWATVVATISAYAIGIDTKQIREGLYGFNAALSGLCLPVLLFPAQNLSLSMLIIVTFAGIACTFFTKMLRGFFAKWSVPALSSPYCVTISLILITSLLANITSYAPLNLQSLIMTSSLSDWSLAEFFHAAFNGASQVLWVEKPICGVLYILAVLLSSRIDAANTVIAIFASTFVSILIGIPKDAVLLGLYGFNAVLLMKVIRREFDLNVRNYIFNIVMASLTPVVCVFFKMFLSWIGISSFLAFPYLTMCIIILLIRQKAR